MAYLSLSLLAAFRAIGSTYVQRKWRYALLSRVLHRIHIRSTETRHSLLWYGLCALLCMFSFIHDVSADVVAAVLCVHVVRYESLSSNKSQHTHFDSSRGFIEYKCKPDLACSATLWSPYAVYI